MTRIGKVLVCSAAVLMAAASAPRAQAEPHHDFHGRDFHHFSPEEAHVWQGGRWVHDWHGGRYAWWWTVDGGWYLYPEPVYPYPLYAPPAVVEQQAPPVPTGMPPIATWYYCDNPAGYYPYVASCAAPWRPVPATPPAAQPVPQAAPQGAPPPPAPPQ